MRILLILGPFLLAIGGLVYLQTGLFAPEADAQTARAGGIALQLTGVTDVSASIPSTPQGTLSQTTRANDLTAPNSGTGLSDMTASVLARLGVHTATPAAVQAPVEPSVAAPIVAATPEPNDEFRTLTSSILSGLQTGNSIIATPEDTSIQGIVNRAMAQGQPSEFVDMLVMAAGNVSVIGNTANPTPTSFLTADGRVNAAVMLSNVTPITPRAPAVLTAEALAQTAIGSDGRRYYTIAAGDSLASLAERFYGSVNEADRIFDANRDKLASPNLIKFGQKLHIPG